MKNNLKLLSIVVSIFTLAGCAAPPPPPCDMAMSFSYGFGTNSNVPCDNPQPINNFNKFNR